MIEELTTLNTSDNIYNLKKITYGSTGNIEIRMYEREIKPRVTLDKDKLYFTNNKLYFQKWFDRLEYEYNRDYTKESRARTVKSIYNISASNSWEWFITLTFDKEKVRDRYDYDYCINKLSEWLKDKRKRNKDFYYIFIPELHKDGAIHFHGIVGNCEKFDFIPSSNKKKSGVYNLKQWNYGFSDCTKVKSSERVAKYICKYVTKGLIEKVGRKRYLASKNCSRPLEDVFYVDLFDYLSKYPGFEEFNTIYNTLYIKKIDSKSNLV